MINKFKNIFIGLLRFSILLGLLGVVFFSISIFAQQPETIGEIFFEVETTPIIQTSAQEIPLLIGLANNFKDRHQLILQDIKVNRGDKIMKDIVINQSLIPVKDKFDRIEVLGWELENVVDESKGREILKKISDLKNEIRSQSFSTSLRIKVADFTTLPNPGDQFLITITANVVRNNRVEKITKDIVISFASPLPGQINWYVGDGHVHSEHSEWDAAYWYKKGHFFVPGPKVNDQALAAKNFGLEWLIMTEHEEMLDSTEWIEEKQECKTAENIYGFPVMIGEEIGSVIPKISQGHYLAYNINSYVDASPFSAQDMIDKTREAEGFGFIAHPDTRPFPWKDWDTIGYKGYELLRGEDKKPKAKTLHRWNDQLEIDQKPVIIGNSDAHWPKDVGQTRTYLYIEGPITHDSIYSALKNGNVLITNGPLITFTINDVIIGKTTNVPPGEQATLHIQWTSNEDFGPMKEILVISKGGKILDRFTKDIQSISGSTVVSYPINEATYFRLVGESSNGQVVYTNPIWVTNFPIGGLANTPWPMFHHDIQHTGQSPYLGAQTSNVKWIFNTGNEFSLNSSPAVGKDGTIYIGSNDNKVFAINPNGTLKWTYLTGGRISSSPTIGADGTIYIGSDDGKLYAINSGGTLKWSYFVGSSIQFSSSPVIGLDGTIYVGSSKDFSLYAINPNGTLKWKYQGTSNVFSSPAINVDGTIYFDTADAKVYALTPNGNLKWIFKTDYEYDFIFSSPSIGLDGTIYVGADKGLYAINPDGTLKWFRSIGTVWGTPAVGLDGTIYIGTVGEYYGKFYAFNPDGSIKWTYQSGDRYPVFGSSPAVGIDGTVYVGEQNRFFAILNGSLKWDYNPGLGLISGEAFRSSPAIDSNGTVYVGFVYGKLYAFGD